ncbi:MAG: glycosyltransferase, partial [Leptospiraceae bacterium]|nr:glycosyltransferase [Leptospiraceae bacterium]
MVEAILNRHKDSIEICVFAMNDSKNTYDYPAVVKHQIVATEQKNYVEAAKLINFSDANICILQHEYGIFGGKNGIYLLLLISKLTKPLLVTLHTVLKNPSYSEKAIIQAISHKAEKLIVMSERAREFLIESYGITENKIAIIEHGVPDYDVTDRESFKKKLNLEGRKPILTFGLLSRDKGIETVISALPDIVRKHPEVLYVVIGKTHPAVIKASGEEYRNYLMSLVEKNKLSNHVHFINKFASNEELFSYLGAADIYVIPNLNKAQITSGTLAYAVGAGSAVVSTNFWHAQSLLSQGRGRLFHPGDSASLSSILNELLSKPELLENMRANAYAYGRKTRWPEIGEKYANLIIDTVDNWSGNLDVSEPIINPLALPDFDLTYIEKMTDDTGILQHANYTVPNLKEGYCIDDNARALLLCVMSYRQ